MPFTPFHLGIFVFLWGLLGAWVDPVAVFLGTISPDFEGIPVYFRMFGIQGALHGPLHSPVGLIIDGTIVFLVSFTFWTLVKRFFPTPSLPKPGLPSILFWSFFSPVTHFILDIPLYPEISLLWPLIPTDFNPFYGIVPSVLPYSICVVLGLLGLIMAGIRLFFYVRRISPAVDTSKAPESQEIPPGSAIDPGSNPLSEE